jgi:CBS domain-containing protein
MAVVTDDNEVLGFVTKSNLTKGLVKHDMDLSHGIDIKEFMTPLENMVLMSKHSAPEEVLKKMREHTCKHMPLTDDFEGNLLFIADIRDIVSSLTTKPKPSGKASTSAVMDNKRDSIFVSKSGKAIDFRSLQSRMNLLEGVSNDDSSLLSPFADGFHVIWDKHRFSLVDSANSLTAQDLENAMNIIRQSSMETWPPNGSNKDAGKRVSIAATNDFFNYLKDEADSRRVSSLSQSSLARLAMQAEMNHIAETIDLSKSENDSPEKDDWRLDE